MITHDQLTKEQKIEIFKKASAFYLKYRFHVKDVMHGNKYSVPPSGSDLFKPELWKGCHWNWWRSPSSFLNEMAGEAE